MVDSDRGGGYNGGVFPTLVPWDSLGSVMFVGDGLRRVRMSKGVLRRLGRPYGGKGRSFAVVDLAARTASCPPKGVIRAPEGWVLGP